MIVDTPPCGMLSDASAIARMTDGAVMVVRQDSARIDRILNGVENIADTGVNLNRVCTEMEQRWELPV